MFQKLLVFSIAIWQATALQGGVLAPVGQFPSFVAVFVPTPTAVCGGAVINPNHALTLSSCLLIAPNYLLPSPSQVSIMNGHNLLDFNRTRIIAQAIYVNPRYNPFTLENDIAVVRTNTPFIFPEVANPPLSIGIISNRIAHDTLICNVAAWNRNNNQQQTINVPIFNHDNCNSIATNFGIITETAFCAGVITAGAGVCAHNLGAILYCNGMIEGVLNSGFGCGAANNPGIYVSARHHNEWIQEQILRQDVPAAFSFPLERLP